MTISRFVNSGNHGGGTNSDRIAGVSVAAASLAMVTIAPFGTGLLPLPSRILFWTVLIGCNAWKWRQWSRLVPPLLPSTRRNQLLVALGGAILLNAMLPFEIGFMYSAVGFPQDLPFAGLFLTAFALSLSVSAVIAAVSENLASLPMSEAGLDVGAPPKPIIPPPSGLAARIDLVGLCAVVAEDHYLRLHFANGREHMLLYRFTDAVRELAGIDGLQVHRGAWVAAAAQPKGLRDGRKWRLQLKHGAIIAVSDTYLPMVRRRGWLGQ